MIHRRQQHDAAGFSLIEVMVATSIVLILVVLVGSVFRQASSAWDSGYARAEGGMVVRGVLGAIQRELSRAVDGRHFPGAWPLAYRDDPVYVSDNGKTLAFIRPEFDYIPPDTASFRIIGRRLAWWPLMRPRTPLRKRTVSTM